MSQNCCGLKTTSYLVELIDGASCAKAFMVGLQETWRVGLEELEQDGWLFLGIGPAQQHGRGSLGVGLLLGRDAQAASSRPVRLLMTPIVSMTLLH